ncbi:MAG: hypothetical protein H0A75_01420 [Candidatus Methanofishera endochildressiae]|uniref:Uncharacterized protein n=1 Tax=Candidatus Methanofishera endochildressiae TaxID=2738884 RepID=A0A7Z0MMR8_9GAMM|nr:hypothetical protein [Candidatus Methanofishera endochildressiae]
MRAKITLVSTRKVNNINTVLVEKRSINGQLHIQKSAAQRTDTKFTARLIADGVWKKLEVRGQIAITVVKSSNWRNCFG